MDAREAACRALARVEQGEKSNEVINEMLSANGWQDLRDRALFTKTVLGTLQNRIFLDMCIGGYSSVRMEKMRPMIRNLLRLSAYQLCFLDAVPAHAVCNEAVKLTKKLGYGALTRFVNALCRKLAENIRGLYDLCDLPAVRYSFPRWIEQELKDRYTAEETVRIMEAFQGEPAPLTARFNLSKAGKEEILSKLHEQGIRTEPSGISKNAWFLKDHPAPGEVAAFQEGLIQYQDLTSILAVEALALQPGEKVLDLCAAPGGKTIAAADAVRPEGSVTSCDVSEGKLSKIQENAERCGFSHVIPVMNDASLFRPEWESAFDAVIADLPCSGLGTLGHKPEVRYRVTPQDVAALSKLQRTMLTHAARYLKPGGRLLFSTCTFTRAENDDNTAFLDAMQELEPFAPAISPAKPGQHAVQLMPDQKEIRDGFFIACFRRR
ncbi:MAG: 16S rRNA (cytosine(967)-C(5))-methyltransferase RsmB [Lachnospiraceae bacterium]|nr:16S rRNA (cytosine(967)-C(5))-methyltransferase RsmB [Lachnospiraceae bacterium]